MYKIRGTAKEILRTVRATFRARTRLERLRWPELST